MSPPPPQYIRTVPRRSVNSHWVFFWVEWLLEGKQPSTAQGLEGVLSLSLPAFCPGGSAGYPRLQGAALAAGIRLIDRAAPTPHVGRAATRAAMKRLLFVASVILWMLSPQIG